MVSKVEQAKRIAREKQKELLKDTPTDLLEISEAAHKAVSGTLDSEDFVSPEQPSEES